MFFFFFLTGGSLTSLVANVHAQTFDRDTPEVVPKEVPLENNRSTQSKNHNVHMME